MCNTVFCSIICGSLYFFLTRLTSFLLQLKSDDLFRIPDRTLVRRFLYLGSTIMVCYVSKRKLTMKDVNDLCDLIQKGTSLIHATVFVPQNTVKKNRSSFFAGKGLMMIQEILKISASERAPQQDPIMFALALCARYQVNYCTRVFSNMDMLIYRQNTVSYMVGLSNHCIRCVIRREKLMKARKVKK